MRWSTWLQHHGGKCPVTLYLKVRCICRGDVANEYLAQGYYVSADKWDWTWDGTDKDIILYQYENEHGV